MVRIILSQLWRVDEATDLALVNIDVKGLIPVKWEAKEPKVGQLLVTPGGRTLLGRCNYTTRP
jgi:hypothetical protein